MKVEKMLLVDKLARLAENNRSWWRKMTSLTRSAKTRLLA
jgi:hypothetical protein